MGWQPSKNQPKPLPPRPRKSDVDFETNPPNSIEVEWILASEIGMPTERQNLPSDRIYQK